jgi:hypothetical protein
MINMPGSRPTYFIPPNFDNPPPPDGPIKLGQLISNFDDPATPIDRSGPQDPAASGLKIHSMSQKIFKLENQENSSTEGGLFVGAVQGICGRLGIRLAHQSYATALDQIEVLVSQFIQPADEDTYVETSMNQPAVQKFIKKGLFRKRVFMVTGIKIAHPDESTAISSTKGSSTTSSAVAEVSNAGAGTGGSVSAAANVARSASSHKALSFLPAEPFVYAYRLRECFYGGRSKEHTKGALLSARPGTGKDKQIGLQKADESEGLDFVLQGLADEDLSLEDVDISRSGFVLQRKIDETDGTECDCAVPTMKLNA